MFQIDNKILIGIILVLIFYIYQNKSIEKMSNTESIDKKVEESVKKIYLADINAIRNLSEVSKKLQSGGLTIPGNLRVEGNLVVDKDSNVKGTSTIHTLDGGKYTGGGGWKDIELKDKSKGFRFIVGDKKFGFHPNGNGLHYQYSNNKYGQMPMYAGANVLGNLKTNNLHVNDYTYTNRLDIKGKRGTTHFNHANRGQTYLRDSVVDGSNLVPVGKTIFLRSRRNGSVLQNTYNTAKFNNWNKQSWERMYLEF